MTTEQVRQAATRAAQEARRSHRARESAQATATSVEQQVATISPTAAKSLGVPLDPSQGYSLDPKTRPAELPRPGESPGGAEQKRTGNIFAGHQIGDMMGTGQLADDHDEIFPPPPRPTRPTTTMPDKKEHPVLASLREDLCVDVNASQDVEIGGHVWTMTVLTPGDIATAARLADQLAVGQTERQFVYETSVVVHAISAIDHVPTYQVFNVEMPPGMVVTNPLRPPRSVRYQASGHLYDFIIEQAKTTLATRLYEAYLDKIDASGAVTSYLDDPRKRKVRFRCAKRECEHEVLVIPRFHENRIQVPVCQWCGEEMEAVSELLEPDSPLT